MRTPPTIALVLFTTALGHAGALTPGPRAEGVVASAVKASPTLRGLVDTVVAAPHVDLTVVLRQEPPGLRAHARLDVSSSGLSGTVFVPPGRFGDQAILLAHELTHVIDVLEGFPGSGPDAEARAVAAEERVKAEIGAHPAACRASRHRTS